jgi:hypothetical protein
VNIPKHVAGIVLSVFVFVVSVFVVGILTAPLRLIPPVPFVAPSTRSVVVSQPVAYRVQLVSLDFINQTSYTTLMITRERNSPAPDKFWVSTSFFVPEQGDTRWPSGAVEISEPFANGGSVASLTVAVAFPSRLDARAPRAGYYALVAVSTVSGEDADRRAATMAADIETAVPVLVQYERKPVR